MQNFINLFKKKLIFQKQNESFKLKHHKKENWSQNQLQFGLKFFAGFKYLSKPVRVFNKGTFDTKT